MEISKENADKVLSRSPSPDARGFGANANEEWVNLSPRRTRDEDDRVSRDDISEQIGRALQNFAPYFIRKMNETMEGAVNSEIARMIREEVSAAVKDEVSIAVREEFEKRFPEETELGVGNKSTPVLENQVVVSPVNEKFSYKNFTVCKPPTYDGDVDPIVSTRWISEIEGSFRTTQCPTNLKVTFGASMLRGIAKRWWDDLITTEGEEKMIAMPWADFKAEFFKNFRSEAEVTKLRRDFLATKQESQSVNVFTALFMDRAQFLPEYLNNDGLMKEHFYCMLRTDIRQHISLIQVESFRRLVDIARSFEVEQNVISEEYRKRKLEAGYDQASGKKLRTGGSNDSLPSKGMLECKVCGKQHAGECRLESRKCYQCGKVGHVSKDCKSSAGKPLVCFKCNREGHKRIQCPLLTDEEKRFEQRKEAERKLMKMSGSQTERSFQISAKEAREATDDVPGAY